MFPKAEAGTVEANIINMVKQWVTDSEEQTDRMIMLQKLKKAIAQNDVQAIDKLNKLPLDDLMEFIRSNASLVGGFISQHGLWRQFFLKNYPYEEKNISDFQLMLESEYYFRKVCEAYNKKITREFEQAKIKEALKDLNNKRKGVVEREYAIGQQIQVQINDASAKAGVVATTIFLEYLRWQHSKEIIVGKYDAFYAEIKNLKVEQLPGEIKQHLDEYSKLLAEYSSIDYEISSLEKKQWEVERLYSKHEYQSFSELGLKYNKKLSESNPSIGYFHMAVIYLAMANISDKFIEQHYIQKAMDFTKKALNYLEISKVLPLIKQSCGTEPLSLIIG